jgi:outer membrane lipoprotein-sorting protein
LSFSDFRPAPNLQVPYRIHFESPESKTQLTVEYTDLETNPSWEESDFHLPVPRGTEVIHLQ